MLYDPKWNQKVAPLSLDNLIAWLEKQPAKKQYNFLNCDGGCLFSLYLIHLGYPASPRHLSTRPIWEALHDTYGDIAYDFRGSHTFGAALERARAMRDCPKS